MVNNSNFMRPERNFRISNSWTHYYNSLTPVSMAKCGVFSFLRMIIFNFHYQIKYHTRMHMFSPQKNTYIFNTQKTQTQHELSHVFELLWKVGSAHSIFHIISNIYPCHPVHGWDPNQVPLLYSVWHTVYLYLYLYVIRTYVSIGARKPEG